VRKDQTYCNPPTPCSSRECFRHISNAPECDYLLQADLHESCENYCKTDTNHQSAAQE
jgi:hypothetical protein